MIKLYINNELCTDILSLKKFLERKISKDSATFYDLVDYGKSGELETWLLEIGEDGLSDEIRQIDKMLDDFNYVKYLSIAISGQNNIRMPFNDCIEITQVECKSNELGVIIKLCFKKKNVTNETFLLKISNKSVSKSFVIDALKYENEQTFEIVQILNVLDVNSDLSITFEEEEIAHISKNKIINDNNNLAFIIKDIFIHFIKVNGGTFNFCGTDKEQGNDASILEKEAREVVNVSDFYIMETPVTQELWVAVMGNNPSQFKGLKRPVTNVSYYDCCDFAEKISKLANIEFKIPTEKEWEFAARGGNPYQNCKYSGINDETYGNNFDQYAWYNQNSNNVTHDVKKKKPNSLGIYDMSGNVWEWCSTKYFSKNMGSKTSSYDYINRGGCAKSTKKGCRVSRRYHSTPSHKSCYLGLRLALVI